jgi:O-succinylbenzoic acid--CoA ligase
MTEAASTVTAKRADGREGCGGVLPRRNVLIRDGHICIGGETLAQGYYHQGKIMPLVDQSGWFDSKDIGVWSADELCVTGRADNQFISGGENVHCEEIEAVLMQHQQVQTAIVVPVADQVFGARPVAIIAVVSTELMPLPSELDAWLNSRLEKFKWPIAYYPMPPDLLSRGIKVSRAELKVWLKRQRQFSPL